MCPALERSILTLKIKSEMITKENLSSVFDLLTRKVIDHAFESSADFVHLSQSSYGSVSLDPVAPIELSYVQTKAEENGDICCDKDTLLNLFIESQSTNKAFDKWI
jgi:hypothetical protein